MIRLTPLMKRHLDLAARGADFRAPPPPVGEDHSRPALARLVSWPCDEAPGMTVLPPWKRAVRRRVRDALDEGQRGPVRLVAAPDGVRILRYAPAPTLTRQVRETCQAIGCSLPELLGPTKVRPLAVARAELYWLGQAHYGLSLPQIGRVMGGRDHTTILNGRRRALAAFRAAGITTTDEALNISAEARRELILAHYIAVAGHAHQDQRSGPA